MPFPPRVMTQPYYPQTYAQPWPPQQYQQRPQPPAQAQTWPPRPPVAAAPRPPIARAQMPEERPVLTMPPPPAELLMPSPAQAGITPLAKTLPVDWSVVRSRLGELGAAGFQCEMLPTGGVRFACHWSNGAQATADAATEEEAVRGGLEKAAALVSRK